MQKLQDTIDTLFADINPKPRPIALTNTAILRDRRLAEIASRIQKLKAARLKTRSQQ